MDFDINDLPLESEDLEGATADYFEPEGRRPILPGRYVSRSREHAFHKTAKGKPAVRINFGKSGAFETLKGESVKDFPPFETLYFFKQKPWEGEGSISKVSLYLKACKQKFQNFTKEELVEALRYADSVPVVAIVAWKQDYKEVAEYQATDPEYKPKKTAFFKDGAGNFVHQKKDEEGRTCTARAEVVGYEVYRG